MKLTIAHSETIRQINGPFEICGSGKDLKNLANQILKKVESEDGKLMCYGWISIVDKQEPISMVPRDWDI